MSKNPKHGQVPVTVHQEMHLKIEIDRDRFLSIAKKLHKEIKKTEKNTSEFKLSEVQELLAKSFGRRNWREMDENFTSQITYKRLEDVLPPEDTTKNQNFNNLNIFLRALKPTEIAKVLTFNATDDLWGKRTRNLALILSHIIYQYRNKNWDRSEIYNLASLDTLYTLYTSVLNNEKETDILIYNQEEEDDFIDVELTGELRANVIQYVQSLTNYKEYEFDEINKVVSLSSNTIEFHGYHLNQININLLRCIENDFLMFDVQWYEKQNRYSWKEQFLEFHDFINEARKQFNWNYPTIDNHTFYFAEIIILLAKTVIPEHHIKIREFILNVLNNYDSFKELIEHEQKMNNK